MPLKQKNPLMESTDENNKLNRSLGPYNTHQRIR